MPSTLPSLSFPGLLRQPSGVEVGVSFGGAGVAEGMGVDGIGLGVVST